MKVGQKVKCINGQFPEWFRRDTKKYPIKGKTYTIRAVCPRYEDTDETSATVGILLEELKNKPVDGIEAAFAYHHFVVVDDPPDTNLPNYYDRV